MNGRYYEILVKLVLGGICKDLGLHKEGTFLTKTVIDTFKELEMSDSLYWAHA